MKRRIIAALMALCLCIGLLPATALAVEGDETANWYQIADTNKWIDSVLEKAGYGTNVKTTLAYPTTIRLMSSTGDYSIGSPTLNLNGYYTYGWLADGEGKMPVERIDWIIIDVDFYLGDGTGLHQATAAFHPNEYTTSWDGDNYVFTLNNTPVNTGDYSVTFYFQPIGHPDWQLYDIVYVNAGESLGADMPPEPNYGTYDFVSWQTSTDGGGDTLTSTTVINKDWTVYGTKTSAGGGTAYHVMRDSDSGRYNALQDELADLYNAENGTAYGKGDVQIDTIQVNGEDGEYTNPIYHTNGWNDGSSYYYIYNIDAYASDSTPDKKNTRVPVNEVTGITVTGGIGDQEFTLTIPEDEFSLEEITNAGSADTIIEIRVLEKLDGIKKEIVKNQADVPEGIKDITLPDENNKVTIPDGGSVTLLYKITVTGDEKAQYIVTDEGATQVSGDQLSGTLDADGEAVIYVTKTFTEATDGKLTNSATLQNNETTLPPDSGDDEDEVIVDVDGEDDDYAITGIDKALVDSEDEKFAAQNAGIVVGNYTYPNDEGTVIIPEDGNVTLLYAITVEGKPGASFTVTDKDAELVAIDGVEITQTDDTFTGSIPAGAASITFYVSKTFDADNLENASEGDGTVLKNTATVAGDADPDEDEDTEETPAEEDVTTISRDVYVYLRVEGTGEDGALTSDEQELVSSWGLTHSEPETYYILGKLSDVELPEDIPTTGELTYEKYATYIKQAFTDNKFTAYKDNKNVDDLLKQIDSWEKLSWAYGAPEYVGSDTLCLHLDGVLKLKSSYDLTYDANGGKINGKETYTEPDIPAAEAKDYTLSDKIVPEHSNDAVVFAGWTLTDTEEEIYSVKDAKNGSVPAAVEAVDLTENDTVYALWSYDADDDGTPDINEIIVTPADITIYTGGDSYTGEIVDSKGDPVTSGGEDEMQDYNGFPEPGFYITLPTALNDQLRGDTTGPVNLSEKLSFVYENEATLGAKHWTLQMYNPASGANNIAYKKFIYQLEPGDEQAPVRLLIKDAAGKEQPSDRFEFDVETLYQEYTMTIYGGGNVETNEVQAVIEGDTYSVFVDTGDLTVRGVKGEDSTSAVVTEKPEELDKITAVAADDVTYYINESAIPVRDDAEIHLLADELAATPDALVKAAKDAIQTELENPEYDFMYLDLVDSSNGNAYVTLGDDDTITIHWPIPGDAKEGSAFYVVHFDGLDRDYDVDTELEGLLTDENITVYEKDGTNDLTVSEDGKSVSFKTSTFSPFALVYEKTSTPTEQVTVTFEVVNGTWSDGSSRNIVYTINKGTTLASNSIAVPTGMRPNSGYTGGSWDTTPTTTTPLNSNVTYTYSFTRSGGGSESKPYLRFDSNGGTEFDPIDENGRDFSINVYDDDHYGTHIPTRPGYRFTGWYNTNTLRTRIDEDEILRVTSYRTVFAGWEETSVPSMLNGDDHYAYIQGYSDGTVRPNANITRAQVATIFFRLLDEDVRDDNLTTYNTFPDVDEDYWANTAISTMASLGVINGRNSGLFDPDAYITRAEFAAICARFDDSGVDGITTFTDTVGHWAEDEISRAAALGWIQGYSDGTFRPNQYITRAQAVTMINRVLCRLPEDTDDLLSGMNTWTDCHEDDWFYLAIQEATNSHDFVAKDRVYESWTDLNRAPDWSRYE